MKYLVLIALVSACTTHKEKASPADRREQLEGLRSESHAALNAQTDADGWPSKTDCDGTLWAGLACAGGYPTKIELAEYKPGEIHRRPAPSCWDGSDKGARSTVSNDMLLGYMWCRWQQKDLGAFQRLADYGENHEWVMGQPDTETARVVLKPNLLGILGRALFALSDGADKRSYRTTPQAYFPVSEDYEQHLQALAIVLYGEVTELKTDDVKLTEIQDHMLERLEELAAASPQDPGFATALGVYKGDMTKAADLFLDTAIPIPTYVRGDNAAAFAHAERLFWLSILLKRMKTDG